MLLLFIIIGIIAYAAGDEYFELFKYALIIAAFVFVVKYLFLYLRAWLAKIRLRRTNQAALKAQRELIRSLNEVQAATRKVSEALDQMSTEDIQIEITATVNSGKLTE